MKPRRMQPHITNRKYWFPAKPPGLGWGWGWPQTWQGWVVYAGFFVLLIAGAVLIAPHGAGIYLAYVFALAALLVLIGFWKGEPPGPLFGRGRQDQRPD